MSRLKIDDVWANMNDLEKLNYAVNFVEAVFPLPRCEHQNPLGDRSGARLFPSCGCLLKRRIEVSEGVKDE